MLSGRSNRAPSGTLPDSRGRCGLEGVVALARLYRELFAVQGHFQFVELAVEFLGRESEDVNVLRRIRSAPEALVQIIVVVEERPASAVGQVRQHIAAFQCLFPVKARPHHGVGWMTGVWRRNWSGQATHVQGVD